MGKLTQEQAKRLLSSTRSRFVISQALAIAERLLTTGLVELQEPLNAADMKMLREHLFPEFGEWMTRASTTQSNLHKSLLELAKYEGTDNALIVGQKWFDALEEMVEIGGSYDRFVLSVFLKLVGETLVELRTAHAS